MPNITLNYFKTLYEFPFPILQMKINQITTDAWLGKVTHYGGGGSLIIKPFPSPGDLPDPETESASPAWQANSLPLSHL